MPFRRLLLLLALLAPSAHAQIAPLRVRPEPSARSVHAAQMRFAGALGGLVVAALVASDALYDTGGEDVSPAVFLLVPVSGAAGGAYLVGRFTGEPGTLRGTVVGTLVGIVPGTVVLAASGGSEDAELAGALLFVGGAALGATFGYGSERLAFGLTRLPGATAPALRVRF